ncbi:hypothetical protein [Streptomyces sporangiiformans]|uniref:Uncharacterized protein n=1 Tax=Streptomyces sporangiiformans TaxID=2315329 RepID=A0A505DI09_9ACTN|nr:hypothetical protein [Streptomyces sporangiiformans]TPQ20328.1 hypothetical protein FGD71_020855 [Streptomyces sporangiiformans]
MVRNVLGQVLALIGAAAAVWSPFQAWYNGRDGQYYRLEDLFTGTGITTVSAELFASLFLPFVVAALITLIGLVLRLRVLVVLAGLIVLGFTILWMVRIGLVEGSFTISGEQANGLGVGTALAFGGGVLLLLGAVFMRGRGGRGKHVKGRRGYLTPVEHPESYEPYESSELHEPEEPREPREAGEPTAPTTDDEGPTGPPGPPGPPGLPRREPDGPTGGPDEDAPTQTWPRPPPDRG